MKIEWVKNCEIEIVENEDFDTVVEERKVGETDDVDIIGYATTVNSDNDKNFPQLQFGDGSVTLAVSADWFKVVD